ncbi:PAS domain S-box protein [Desulfovibrio brasiliensis]
MPNSDTLTEPANNAIHRLAMECIGTPMAVNTLSLDPVFTNAAYIETLGIAEHEVGTPRHREVFPEGTYRRYHSHIRPALERGESWEGEYGLRLPNGGERQVAARFDPVRDDSGTVTHVCITLRDISEHARLRDSLERSERYLRFLAESDTDLIFRVTIPEGQYEYISSAVGNITGYPAEAFYMQPSLFFQILPREHLREMRRRWLSICRGNHAGRYQFPVLHKDGSTRWLETRLNLVRDQNGNPVAIEGIATDITERRQTRHAAAEANARFRFLADNMADSLWSADDTSRLTYLSPSAKQVLGLDSSSLVGRRLESLFRNDYKFAIRQWINECSNAGEQSSTVELPYDHPELGKRWIAMTGTEARIGDGGTQLLGFFRDVTRRRRALERLHRSEGRYRTLFEDSPISLWEEDLSELRVYLDQLIAEGVTDFKSYFSDNPEALAVCCRRVRVLDVNRATVEMMGAPDKRPLLGTLANVIPEESYPTMAELFAHIAEGGTNYQGEVINRTPNGDIRWVMVHFSVPREYRKTLERVLVSLIDLTPRKKTEQALRESERRYKALVDNSGEGVLVVQKDAVVFANNALHRILGIRVTPGNTDTVLNYVHPLDRAELRSWLEDDSAGEHFPSVLRIFTGSGELHWLTLSRRGMEWQTRPATMFIVADVTTHKLLERELLLAHAEMEERVTARTAELNRVNRQLTAEVQDHIATQELLDESRLSFKALLDASPDFICLLDLDLNVLAANTISLNRFGLDPLELQSRHLPELLAKKGGAMFVRTAKGVLQTAEAARYTEVHLGRTYDQSIYPVLSDKGELQRLAYYSRDVTEQIRAEERIRSLTSRVFSAQETERQRIARDLHDNVAQDLSSALVAIEALEASKAAEIPMLGGMQISQVLRRSVAAVRDIAYGLHPPGLEQLGLGTAVKRLCDDFENGQDITLDFSSTGLDALQFDFDAATNIYRIIQEALNNAAKHAGAGRMSVRLVAAHPDIIIRVEDDGKGFDVPRRMLEAADNKRMGLRSIEERSRLLGGEATIHSVPGSGTKITVKLPTAACTR